jgi:hypothetical protein
MNKDKIIVTQTNPDLDACMSIWLLTRFAFPGIEYELRFLPVGKRMTEDVVSGREVIYVDTGGSKYDHHHTSEYVCAASLVADDLELKENEAIARMIRYTLKVDHGQLFNIDVSDFDLINVIEGMNIMYAKNPKTTVIKLLECLDAVYRSLLREIEAEGEIKRIIVFDTKWGRGAALSSSNKFVRYLCHRKGYIIFIYVDPVKGYRGFTAPGDSGVDFSIIYERVRNIEPDADWFLHSSKELLLCGSAKAPDRKLSSLTLEQMISLVRM